MLGNTNSHADNGGGDTIYLKNESGSTITANKKVLCDLGTIGTSSPTSFTHANSSYFNPILFFDDNAFVTSDNNTGYMHSKSDGVWSSETNSLFRYWGEYGLYTFHDNGVISSRTCRNNDEAGYIYTKTGRTQLPSYCIYIGEYNNVHYCIKGRDYTVSVYDIDSNTTGATAATFYTGTYVYLIWGKIVGNKCIVRNTAGATAIYSIDNEGTFTLLGTSATTGYFLYATGGNVGDYVFVTDNNTGYNAYNNFNSHLLCYRVQSDYTLAPVSVPALQAFENEACLVCYDNRNDVISIGIDDNAYFYQFDRANGTFINLDTEIDTYPTNPNSYPYKAMMSPDKTTIVIMGYGNYVNVYSLTTAYHRIVPNSSYYYNDDTSLTGMATGETDSDGNYEVMTVLPEVVNWSVASQLLEPDEINIYGGAE